MIPFLRLIVASIFTIIAVITFSWGFLISYRQKIKIIKPVSVKWASFMLNKILKIPNNVIYPENIPEQDYGFISVSNHQSFIDILVINALIRRQFLMKSSMLYTPFGPGALLSGAIPVNRADSYSHLRVMNRVIRTSASISAIHIFPEGTRSADGSIAPFKLGTLKMIYKNKLNVLPSGLWGSHLVLPKKTIKFRPKVPIVLTVGKLINPNDFSDSNSFVLAVEQEVRRLVEISKKEFNTYNIAIA